MSQAVTEEAPALELPSLDTIQYELAERRLIDFTRLAWHLVEPGRPFVPSWHLDFICEHLELVAPRQELTHLVINIPFRMSKSTLAGVMWQPWVWATRPAWRWIFGSYDQTLATRDNVRSRRIIESPWYRRRWGNEYALAGDQNVKTKYENDHTGHRIAAGVGSGITGEGFDTGVVDDPHNVKKRHSKAHREAVIDWYDNVFSTRANDPDKSGRVVIQQRCHKVDLTGHVLKSEGGKPGFLHIKLPMEAPSKSTFYLPVSKKVKLRRHGELLCPARFSAQAVSDTEVRLGKANSAAQLGQEPVPEGGSVIPIEAFCYWQRLPEHVRLVFQSWDTAFEDTDGSDWSAGGTWVVDEAWNIYLVDLFRKRLTFPDLLAASEAWFVEAEKKALDKWGKKVSDWLIEKKASGHSLIQCFKRVKAYRRIVRPITPDRDKVARAHAATPTIDASRVFLPENAPWLETFLDELEGFPADAHDDQVDMATQAINWVNEKQGKGRPRVSGV